MNTIVGIHSPLTIGRELHGFNGFSRIKGKKSALILKICVQNKKAQT